MKTLALTTQETQQDPCIKDNEYSIGAIDLTLALIIGLILGYCFGVDIGRNNG